MELSFFLHQLKIVVKTLTELQRFPVDFFEIVFFLPKYPKLLVISLIG